MGIIASILIAFSAAMIFAVIVYWMDRYEKEPKLLLGAVFFWGAFVAAGAAFLINTTLGVGVYLFTNSDFATDLTTSSLIAPVVEEILKGGAVIVVFLFYRQEFDSILDGIIYAAVAALGFSATENAFYIYTHGYAEAGWAGLLQLTFVRIFLVGWQHPFYTAFFGIGLALARLNRSVWVKIFAPALGLGFGMFAHSFHNTLATLLNSLGGLLLGTFFDWSGWILMVIFILWAIYREKKWLVQYLADEVQLGTLSIEQYRTACSAFRQSLARFSAVGSGRYSPTDRFYQVCAELAYKKMQLAELGNEAGNQEIIQGLRGELSHLAPLAKTLA